MNRNDSVQLYRKPEAGLIPRGVVGREYMSGRTEWSVSKGDLVQAHKLHLHTARYATFRGSTADAAFALADAATVRRMLTQRVPVRSTRELLRKG